MSFDQHADSATPQREGAPAIELKGVGKTFYRYHRPLDRLLLQFNTLRRFARFDTVQGIRPLNLTIGQGEVIGLVGRNGAGKSTLLQLVCETLAPSSGEVTINGKVAALLELGSGFNPEFTGRENVYMSASIAGLNRDEVDARMEDIHTFSGIGDFINQPVKTYSSGMYVRLAFAVATSVSPDILVIDEALSVGDGAFARKSFDRIMALRNTGATILFCSHSMYQVESLCERALWVEGGEVVADGAPSLVVPRYEQFLAGSEASSHTVRESAADSIEQRATPTGGARILHTELAIDDQPATPQHPAESGQSDISVSVTFASDPALPCPSVAVTISTPAGQIITSAGSWDAGLTLERNARGEGLVTLLFPQAALLKGEYHIGAYLFCERGLHSYEWVDPITSFYVTQHNAARGLVVLPHQWQVASVAATADE
ncbi:ABC transporter ATP-binding protein [Vreelandella jeotgali]|uniref:ABC transporter ATP-binding protein n=1 Tax=Vreelandella jeotgali TaxID=553386 RepID=UPI000344D408|nr:ABC transporter ATP-binding protein [Halomonas jeotgali]